jgi:hypothetical protein
LEGDPVEDVHLFESSKEEEQINEAGRDPSSKDTPISFCLPAVVEYRGGG